MTFSSFVLLINDKAVDVASVANVVAQCVKKYNDAHILLQGERLFVVVVVLE